MNNPQQCENRFRDEYGYEVQCEKEASFIVDTGTKSAFLICVGCKNKRKVHKSRLTSAPLPAIETDAKIEAVRDLVRAALAALSQKTTHQADIDYAKSLCRQALEE